MKRSESLVELNLASIFSIQPITNGYERPKSVANIDNTPLYVLFTKSNIYSLFRLLNTCLFQCSCLFAWRLTSSKPLNIEVLIESI